MEAGSADDALKAAQKETPDVALVDFNMPGKDGLALAADLRALQADMPIGIISANHQQSRHRPRPSVGRRVLAEARHRAVAA